MDKYDLLIAIGFIVFLLAVSSAPLIMFILLDAPTPLYVLGGFWLVTGLTIFIPE